MPKSALGLFLALLVVPSNPHGGGVLEFPAYTLIGANILVGVTDKGAVFSGRYRFLGKPQPPPKPPFFGRRSTSALIPVPIPASLKNFDEIEAAVRPFITLKGTKYRPGPGVSYYDVPSLPQEIKIAVFSFLFQRDDLDEAFDLLVQFEQPLISVGSRELIYYIPFIPSYDKNEQEGSTRRPSLSIAFESYGTTELQFTNPPMQVEHSAPKMIVVRPQHGEIIAIERKKPNKAPEPTPGSVTPRASSR